MDHGSGLPPIRGNARADSSINPWRAGVAARLFCIKCNGVCMHRGAIAFIVATHASGPDDGFCSARRCASPALSLFLALSVLPCAYICVYVYVCVHVFSFTLAFAFILRPLLLHALFFFLVSPSFPLSYSIFFPLSLFLAFATSLFDFRFIFLR